ncbi:ligand-binding sensor domain-containing protein [Sinomicrobium sp. M5D2P17]
MRLTLTIVFSLLHLISYCNQIRNLPNKDYGINWYTDSDGLPQNSVKQIFKDPYGFIWLLTQNGLVRYDGRNFRVFNSKNTSIHNNRMMYALGKPAKDSIFVYNDFGEALLISQRNARTQEQNITDLPYSLVSTPEINSTDSAYIRKKKHIIPASGSDYYIIGHDTVTHHNDKTSETSDIYFPHNSSGYFFTIGSSLYYLEKNGKYTRIHDGKTFHAKTEVPTGDENITGIIYNTISRQTFVHTRKNLYLLQIKKSKLHLEEILSDFDFGPDNSIFSAYYDSYLKIIYLGSKTKGLGIIKKHNFKSVNTWNTDRVQYALTNYTSNKILTATGAIINVGSIAGKKLDAPWDSDKHSLMMDKQGDIWTKNQNHLYRFRKETNYQEFRQWVLPYPIEQLYKGVDDKIWIAMHLNNDKRKASESSLYYLDSADPKCVPKPYKKLSFSVQYMLQTTDSTLWLGSLKGLYKINLTTGRPDNVNGLNNKQVTSLYASAPDEIWITTSTKGIFLYKNGVLTGFPPDRKGYMLSSHCIVEDNEGYLWISTGKGLFQASKKKMLDYASGKMKQVYYHYYDKSSGFLSNEFTGGCEPCGIKLKNGHMALPSLNGIVIFDPKKVRPELPNGTIYIDEVRTVEGLLPVDQDTLMLNRNFGRVHIHLATPYYDNPYNLNMEFKLEDENTKNWEYIEDGQTITFSQLPPGQHTLVIRKMNSFYSYYINKRITLVVPPYFWETDWFYVLLCLAIPVVIFYSVKLRIKYVRYKNALLKKKIIESTRHLRNTIRTLRITKDKLKQQTAIQEKLIASISHDIRSPLRFMVDTGEYLYANYDTGNKKMIREGIRSMYTASVKIHEFISEILDYSKARMYEGIGNTSRESYDLQHLIGEKISLFTEIANSQRTRIYNYVPYNFTTLVNKHLLSIIIHNLLDNAVKNTHNGKITLYAFIREKKLRIVIEDTGKGITQKQLQYYQSLVNPREEQHISLDTPSKSLGIKIILDLLIILNGKIDIKSTINKGTRITLIFPMEDQ